MAVRLAASPYDQLMQNDPALANAMYQVSDPNLQQSMGLAAMRPNATDMWNQSQWTGGTASPSVPKADGRPPIRKPTPSQLWRSGFDPTYLGIPSANPLNTATAATPLQSASLTGTDITPPQIGVNGANPVSSYAPSSPQSPAAGAASGMAGQDGTRYVTIGGYNYLTGPDGKLINGADGKPMNMGRSGVQPISTGMIGGMIKSATGADPMTGNESLEAQGVMPSIPKPPVNRTGMLPNGSTFVNGVKTGVGGDMQFLTPAQRDAAVLNIERQNGFNRAADPQAAARRAALEAGSQGTIDTGFTSGNSVENNNLNRSYDAMGYNQMSTAERKAAMARNNAAPPPAAPPPPTGPLTGLIGSRSPAPGPTPQTGGPAPAPIPQPPTAPPSQLPAIQPSLVRVTSVPGGLAPPPAGLLSMLLGQQQPQAPVASPPMAPQIPPQIPRPNVPIRYVPSAGPLRRA